MGPLHIKVNPEKCGFDASVGGVLNEKLDFTEYYKLTKEKTSCSDFATTNIGGIVLGKTFQQCWTDCHTDANCKYFAFGNPDSPATAGNCVRYTGCT